MSDVVTTVSELLTEEKWTRTTITDYTVQNFKELDDVISKVQENSESKEVLELCLEHLATAKESIAALYISGILAITRQVVNDANLIILANIFSQHNKMKIVEAICKKILEFGANKFALRTLAETYESEGRDAELVECWEQLVKVDFDEADIVKKLAEIKLNEGDNDASIEYYKKALHRYISKGGFANIQLVWEKLVEICADETDFFYHAESKIAKSIAPERAAELLEMLYPVYTESSNWEKAIEVLKRVLNHDSKSPWARKEIVNCYKNLYEGHSHLDEYIRVSNLNQSWRNVHEAISDFEKHISFDAGNFVAHRNWGVGRIREIKGDNITIDFVRKRNHTMALKMAVNALQILDKHHIWVLKSVMKKDELKKRVKTKITWALKTIIKSFDNQADMKIAKAELVPSVLTASEWTSWSTQARKILKTNSSFGTLPDNADIYIVRDQPVSYDEKIYNRFKAEKGFFKRLDTFNEYLSNADTESEYFGQMVEFFYGFLRSINQVNEQVVVSAILIENLLKKYPYLNQGVNFNLETLLARVEDIEALFKAVDDSDYKRMLLKRIKELNPEWPDFFVRVFPSFLNRFIIDELEASKKFDVLKSMAQSYVDNYRDFREPFIWLAKNILDADWYNELEIPFEKILIGMTHLLELTNRDISIKKDLQMNRKLNRQVHQFLFKEETLFDFIKQADEAPIKRLYHLVADVRDLDPGLLHEMKEIIKGRFTDFVFHDEEAALKAAETTAASSRTFYATQESYTAKAKQLQHIHEVEVPKNSKEIGDAARLGDLKENAEYKAAKERQDILNSTAAKLSDELERVKIMSADEVDSSKIGFGTDIVLFNKNTNEDENFTILGPWESNPNEKIISYLSPLGQQIITSKVGDVLEFEINERDYVYEVKAVSLTKF